MSPTRLACALTLMLPLTLSPMMGCGGGDQTPCERYLAVSTSCANTYTNATGQQLESEDMSCSDDDGSQDAMFSCMTAAYQGADCQTMQGMIEASMATTECMGDMFGQGFGSGGTGTGGTGTGGTDTGGTGTGSTGTGGTGTGGTSAPPIDLATINAATVRLSACKHQAASQLRDNHMLLAYMETISSHAGWTRSAREVLSCAATAESCEAVLACDGLDTAQTCTSAAQSIGCDGTVQTRCYLVDGCGEAAVGWTEQVDCATGPMTDIGENTQCLLNASSAPSCGAGSCIPGDPSRCEGDVAVTCNNGVLEYRDCRTVGETCVPPSEETGEEGDSTATCTMDTLPTCEASYCDGDTMALCMEGRELVRLDCGDMAPGLTCSTTTVFETTYAECRASEADTECQDYEVACEGTEARWCTGGKWASVDCGTFLDGTCSIQAILGPGAGQRVFCSSPTWDATVDALDGQTGNAWDCPGVTDILPPTVLGDNPCETYVLVYQQCTEEFEAAGGTMDADLPEGYCDDYQIADEATYNCAIQGYVDGDCTSMEGLAAINASMVACGELSGAGAD